MGMRFVASMVASVAVAFAAVAEAATPATIEIAPPPAAYATDANALRAIAAAELQNAGANAKRKFVVSLSVAKPASDEPTECAVDATLRDARTGAVIAVIDTTTRMTGPLSRDERRLLAHAAVRNAARRITAARVLDR